MDQIERQLANAVDAVENGTQSALELFSHLTKLEKFVKECKDQIFETALDEAETYGEKSFHAHGFDVTVREGSITYNYSDNEDVRRLEAELKELKGYLKNASKMDKVIVDEVTGEVYEPCSIKSGSKTSLIIK